MAIDVNRIVAFTFAVGSALAAIGGIMWALKYPRLEPLMGIMPGLKCFIAAVIGGCLLTGGYGTAIGAFLGSIIFGIVMIGLTYTNIDQDWYLVFLGGMLLVAVLFNNIIRKRVTGER